jgi:hypothetical protein
MRPKTNAPTPFYLEQEMTPEQDEANRKKLGLKPPYVERLHVLGAVWKVETQVKELISAGKAPSALDALAWLAAEVRALDGKA